MLHLVAPESVPVAEASACRLGVSAEVFYARERIDDDMCAGCGVAITTARPAAGESLPMDAMLCPRCVRDCDALCATCWAPLLARNHGICAGNWHLMTSGFPPPPPPVTRQ